MGVGQECMGHLCPVKGFFAPRQIRGAAALSRGWRFARTWGRSREGLRMGFLGVVGFAGYVLLGLFQIAATFDGVQHLLGVHWLIAGVIGLMLGAFPVIGTAAGVYGATAAWGWSLLSALGLFFGPLVVIAAISMMAQAGGRR
ncbi:hypothetical protein GAY31_19600 [Azospirillum brasilense]|nr:hypothetical protein [Azospirillum brasilense]